MKRIESTKNSYIKDLKKLHSKKHRERMELFLVEGWHLVEEAIKYDAPIKALIIREGEQLPNHWDVSHVELIYVTDEVMQVISETEHPQGIAAVCHIHQAVPKKFDKLLLLDSVQDPGNVGTLIRTADAAGVDAVILGNGSADLYNSKVLRSTQGSLFHLPVLSGDLSEWIDEAKRAGLKIFGTALENGVAYQEAVSAGRWALIVGNEGSGVSSTILKQTDMNLYVPIYGKAESLNVGIAAGVLMYFLQD